MARQQVSIWDVFYVLLLVVGIPAALFHLAQGRYAQFVMAAAAVIVGGVVYLTGWGRPVAEPGPPVAASERRRPAARHEPLWPIWQRDEQGRLVRHARREGWLARAIIAGFVATGAMSVVFLVAYALSAAIGEIGRDRNLLSQWMWALANNPVITLGRDSLVLAIALHLAFGMIWALIYGGVVEPALRGPAWWRGLLFALLPWLLSLVVFLPLTGGGFLGLALGAGPLPIVGNLLVHLVYGAVLGAVYGPLGEAVLLADPRSVADGELGRMRRFERGMAAGIVAGALLGVVLALLVLALAPQMVASPLAAVLVGACVGGAYGALIGSLAGVGEPRAMARS